MTATLAEFMGFKPGHEHELEMLPVVEFTSSYRCSCGGLLRIIWTEDLAGLDAPLAEAAVRARAYERLRGLEQQPMPEMSP